MKWNPEPYRLKAWEFQFDDDTVKALPNIEVLQEKIAEAAERLSNEIAKAETSLMLQSLTDSTLEKLATLCKNELNKRKKMRLEFQRSFKGLKT